MQILHSLQTLASTQTTLPGAALQGQLISCFKSQPNSHFAQEARGQLCPQEATSAQMGHTPFISS